MIDKEEIRSWVEGLGEETGNELASLGDWLLMEGIDPWSVIDISVPITPYTLPFLVGFAIATYGSREGNK